MKENDGGHELNQGTSYACTAMSQLNTPVQLIHANENILKRIILLSFFLHNFCL
jgi:hypothetical protein